MKKVRLVEVVNDFNKIRVPLSSNQRKLLKKIYPYYGAQGIVDYVEDFLFDGEYLLIAEDGENLKSNNQNICNMVKGKFWVNNHAHILQGKKDNLTRYLYYKLNTINFSPFVTGSSQPKLNKENLFSIEFFIHENIKTQRKIAKILSDIDDKIEILHQINDNLAELAKTIYDYWFVQFDFPDENGKPYKSSGGKMLYNEVLKREIPEGWEVESLGEIEPNIITGKTPPTKDENNFNGNILFITIDDIRQNLFIYNSERTLSEKGANTQRAKFLKKGDICVSCIGTVGVIGIVGKIAQTNQQINSISNPQNFNKYFLLNYLGRYFKDNFTAKKGAVLDNMNKAEFESIIIINPIQNIKEIYYGKVKFLYKKIDTNIQQIQHLQSLRDWLLPMLMNGQISVK